MLRSLRGGKRAALLLGNLLGEPASGAPHAAHALPATAHIAQLAEAEWQRRHEIVGGRHDVSLVSKCWDIDATCAKRG